jgi:hypothetical protein
MQDELGERDARLFARLTVGVEVGTREESRHSR